MRGYTIATVKYVVPKYGDENKSRLSWLGLYFAVRASYVRWKSGGRVSAIGQQFGETQIECL